jgi:hypothetical protein
MEDGRRLVRGGDIERLLMASFADNTGADHYSTITSLVAILGDVELAEVNIVFRSLVKQGMIERDDTSELYHLTETGRRWADTHIVKF